MISRIWHGWATRENADAYEELLKREVFVGIRGRRIPGFQNIQLFRRELDAEVEFVTVMWFDSLERSAFLPVKITKWRLSRQRRERCWRTLMRAHSTTKSGPN
jgi:heme-degrading monooxygenase HmoA